MAVRLAGAVTRRAGLGDRQEAVAAPGLAAPGAHVARLETAPGLDARARARVAALEARDLDLRLEAGGRVLERDLQLVLEILAPRGARAPAARAAREEVLEDVLEQRSEPRLAEPGACAGPRPEPRERAAIVGIGEDRVCLA